MGESREELKTRVVDGVCAAFLEGAGSQGLAEGTEARIRLYWEKCFDKHAEKIKSDWDKGAGDKAIAKVKRMGESAAQTVSAKSGGNEIALEDFHEAREKINSGADQTGWCMEAP